MERSARQLDQSKGLYSLRRATWRRSDDSTSPSDDDHDNGEAVTQLDTMQNLPTPVGPCDTTQPDYDEGPADRGPFGSRSSGEVPSEQASETVGDAESASVFNDERARDPSVLTDYRRRKNRLIKEAALSPGTSHKRFLDSFSSSNAPAALKARFANLAKQ